MMEYSGLFGIIGSLLGGGSIVYLIVNHYLKRGKYSAEVTAIEKNTDAASQQADLKVSVQVRELYNSILADLRKEMDQKLDEEKRLRATQESNCDEKIAKLNREIHALREKINRAEQRCVDGCFAKQSA